MIKVIYNKVCGRCVQSEPLTSGMVGQPIELEYSADFDGLTLTAVFTNGKTTVDVLNPGNQCVIPHEVLDTVGTLVKVGIYAVRGNERVIPTVYATIGVVQNGADPSGDVSIDPTLPVWAQTQAMIGNLNDLTTEAKNNLVAAINEAAQSGGGGGSSIALDTTLSKAGKAADAKSVGDALAGKQDTINDLEAIRTGAAKGATALQSVPNTYRTAAAQDVIDNGLSDRVSAIEGKEAGWNGKYSKPTDGIPKTDLASAVQTSLDKAETALQSVPNTYRTASEQDTIDSGKVDKVTGKGLSTNDYTDAAKAKVDALAPVATSGSYNDLTDKPTIPTSLPNPNALTFTGAATGTYDGSAPLTVEIPSGGGSSGGSTAEWQLLGTYTMLVSDRSLVIDLSQFEGITHFRIIGNFPKCSEDCGQTYIYLGTAFNHTSQPSQKQNVYAFNLLAECELVDGQLYGFIGTIDGWTLKVPASIVINTPRDSGKCTSFKIYYSNAVNDTTENTIQIWGY